MSHQDVARTLYRPTGANELELVRQLAFRAWPPRLFWQPIFYPVLTEEYAVRIARDWNTKDARSGYAGYVTRFRVRTTFLDRYPVREAGGQALREYWIPAEDLGRLNENIVGRIEVTQEFRGNQSEADETTE